MLGFSRKKDIWQAIWHLKAFASTKNFVWKMCSNILPTKDHLYKKHILPDPFCLFCQVCPEDTWHALCTCPASMAFWQECPRPLQKIALLASDGLDLYSQLRDWLNEEDLLMSLMVACQIWFRRNSFVFENVFTPPQQVMCKAKETLEFVLV
jgi:hypothetical protein